MKNKEIFKITNLAMVFERGGVCLPFGESTITAEEWDRFLTGATDESVQFPLRTGAIRAERIDDILENVNALAPDELRELIARTKDVSTLRKWLVSAHENESFWRARLLIGDRLSEMGVDRLSPTEAAELDRRAPWRHRDGYRRSGIDLPDRLDDPNLATKAKTELEKFDKRRLAYEQYQRNLAEIGY
jgi:hypothetical protein